MNLFGGGKDASGSNAAPADVKSGDAGQAPAAAEPEVPISEGAKVSTMKAGDYLVHVHI